MHVANYVWWLWIEGSKPLLYGMQRCGMGPTTASWCGCVGHVPSYEWWSYLLMRNKASHFICTFTFPFLIFFYYDRTYGWGCNVFGPARFGLDLDLIWFRCVGSGLNPTTCLDLVSDLTQSPGILLLCIIYLIIWYMISIYLCIIFLE